MFCNINIPINKHLVILQWKLSFYYISAQLQWTVDNSHIFAAYFLFLSEMYRLIVFFVCYKYEFHMALSVYKSIGWSIALKGTRKHFESCDTCMNIWHNNFTKNIDYWNNVSWTTFNYIFSLQMQALIVASRLNTETIRFIIYVWRTLVIKWQAVK